jgi:hypothetical protein
MQQEIRRALVNICSSFEIKGARLALLPDEHIVNRS